MLPSRPGDRVSIGAEFRPEAGVARLAFQNRVDRRTALVLSQPVGVHRDTYLGGLRLDRRCTRLRLDAPGPGQVAEILQRTAGCGRVEVDEGDQFVVAENDIVRAGIVVADNRVTPDQSAVATRVMHSVPVAATCVPDQV